MSHNKFLDEISRLFEEVMNEPSKENYINYIRISHPDKLEYFENKTEEYILSSIHAHRLLKWFKSTYNQKVESYNYLYDRNEERVKKLYQDAILQYSIDTEDSQLLERIESYIETDTENDT